MAFSKLLLFFLLLKFLTITCTQFNVGGKDGWQTPKSKNDQQFNQWASNNRFIVGDTVRFKYEKDSVLVVTEEEYNKCHSLHPIFFSNNGNTTFNFDRPGLFYFISGLSGHCERGQKMIIKVLEPLSPPPSPPPQPDASTNGTINPPPNHSAAFGMLPICSSIVMIFMIMSFVGVFLF
ncbi:hypothetical protein UlMin_008464 [Ulmus minor]